MARDVSKVIKIELTSEQRQQYFQATGLVNSVIEISQIELAALVLAAMAANSRSIPIARYKTTRQKMLSNAQKNITTSAPYIVMIPMNKNQKEQIRQITGQEMESLMFAPDELYARHTGSWNSDADLIRVGDSIVIVPANRTYTPSIHEHIITLAPIDDAKEGVFGSGNHPTTQLALILLKECIKVGDCVLDVGTGSGILSVAAARFGAMSVLGIDIALPAINMAQATITANNLTNLIQLRHADMDSIIGLKYDVVVANLLPNIIFTLAWALSQVVKPSGLLITSGVIAARGPEVTSVLSEVGFVQKEQRIKDGWHAQVFFRV